MLWRWATIIGLSATPNLIAGQGAAGAAAKAFGLDWRLAVLAAILAGFAEGVVLAWLAGQPDRVGVFHRWLTRLRKPKAVAFAKKWGPWYGLILGGATVGQEPVIVALRWLEVDLRRLIAPIAVGNVLYGTLYFAIGWFGWDQLSGL